MIKFAFCISALSWISCFNLNCSCFPDALLLYFCYAHSYLCPLSPHCFRLQMLSPLSSFHFPLRRKLATPCVLTALWGDLLYNMTSVFSWVHLLQIGYQLLEKNHVTYTYYFYFQELAVRLAYSRIMIITIENIYWSSTLCCTVQSRSHALFHLILKTDILCGL